MSKKTAFDFMECHKVESKKSKKLVSDLGLNKALYRILFNAVNDAIVLIDIHTGSFLEVNDKFCEMTGFSCQEAKGISLAALFGGEFPFAEAQAQEYIHKALTEGPQLFEWLARDRHGRRHWVELNLSTAPIGRKRYLIGTIRNIQARKEAELKAHQGEAAIKALLGALQDTALLLDPDGIIVAANEVAAKRLNRTPDELIGLNVYDLLPPEVARVRRAKAEEILKTGKVVRFSDRLAGIDFYSTVYPIFDSAGRVSQIGVYAMDVSKEKKTQEELEKVKARLEYLLDHSPSALYSSRHTEGCEIIYFSKNIVNLTGFSKEEIMSDPFFWFQHIHPDDRQLFADTHRAGVMAGHQSREYRFLHQDGRYRWLHDEFNLVQDRQGTPLEYVGSLIDITAAREAQKALALSEKRYRAIVECQTDLISRYLPDATLIYVNDAVCRLFGQSQEDLIGKSYLPFLPPEAQQLVQAQLASLTPEQPVGEIEHEVVLPNGQRRWLTLINYAFFDEHGQVREFQGVGRDITRRKKTEDALRESELRFRMYTEGSLVGVHVTQDDRLVYVNPVFAQIFGYTPQELLAGMGPMDLVHPDDRNFLRQKIVERLAGVASDQYCFKGVKKDGSIVYCEILGRLVEYQGRQAILGSLLDITQRREAEAGMQRREQYFRQLTENVSDVIGLLSAEGTISYLNPIIKGILGYTPAELLGKEALQFVHPDDIELFRQIFAKMQRRPDKIYCLELRMRHRNNSWHVWQVKGKNLLNDPVVNGIVINAQDITEQKNLEAALQRSAKKLRSLTAQIFTTQETERRRLSLELHDELGQSLTALKLQLRSISNSLRKDQKRLKQDCMHMLTYINEVVENVRRLSHDLSPSLLENVGLKAALHHLLENYRKFYNISENLQEMEDIEAVLPAEGKIHIYRIFQEILTNIEKHSQATEVSIEVIRSDHHLTCRIADNGRGLPAEYSERPGGTVGLGLPAISERLLMLGGTLEISGNENTGTVIQFAVPLENKNFN